MMMGMMTSGILGPFANYLVPLMIGARRMAFPRIEALTFWLLMAAGTILMTSLVFGGFPTGWTGYAPLNEQANMGIDAYIAFFALVGLSMALLGLNMLATVITMRAPGDDVGPAADLRVGHRVDRRADAARGAGPDLDAPDADARPHGADRASSTTQAGGSSYLYENLFWIFGHPEVYILALPGHGDPARDPAGVLAQAAVGLPPRRHRACSASRCSSFLVWQHHLFVSGINADLRPFYMLSTELISLPTGLHLHLRARHALAGRIRLDGADAVRARLALQLPDRRAVRASSCPTCRAT